MGRLLAFWLLLALLLPTTALAYPGEVKGTVAKVVDGDTIDVKDFGRVRLADIDCPEKGKVGGAGAMAYATKWLLGKIVYLDVDNKTGKDDYGRYVCVVYLAKRDGSLDESKNFNRMIVDSRHGCVMDFHNNEFNPADWWGGLIPCPDCVKSSPDSTGGSVQSGYSSACGRFVGSKDSNEYHYPACKLAKKISSLSEIWFSSSGDAKAHGYVPCKICHPP